MQKAFTLIELLVVIAIIAILVGLSIFGLEGARRSSRDARRKTDLELIRSGLEIYKSDCNGYTLANVADDPLTVFGTTLTGSGDPISCAVGNVYISQVPKDPTSPASGYLYFSDGSTYQ